MLTPNAYAAGRWIAPDTTARAVFSPVNGTQVGQAGSRLDVAQIIHHAVTKGGPALREMTFHQRAKWLKVLATHPSNHKKTLYALNPPTSATPGAVFTSLQSWRRKPISGSENVGA